MLASDTLTNTLQQIEGELELAHFDLRHKLTQLINSSDSTPPMAIRRKSSSQEELLLDNLESRFDFQTTSLKNSRISLKSNCITEVSEVTE